MNAALRPIRDAKTILLTTYTPDGTAVATPVLQSRFVTWRPPNAVRGLRGSGSCFEPGVVVMPAGARLVAASPS